MEKDIVFVIIDSLCQKNVGVGFSGLSTTPSLDKYSKGQFVASKVYSQGPYTEAGTKALLCGEDTLSSGGYLLRYANADSFITDEFYDNGYETYCYMYPSALLSKKTLNKTKHMIYTSGFEFLTIWRQKLTFYADRYDHGELDDDDLKRCIEIMEVVFHSWHAFLNPSNEKEAYRLIADYIKDYDLNCNRKKLNVEMNSFQSDKGAYIYDLFNLKLRHKIFQIAQVDMAKMISGEIISEAFSRCNGFERQYAKMQRKLNKKNNRYSLMNQVTDILKYIKSRNKYDLGKVYNYYMLLNESKAVKRYMKNDFKLIRSANAIFEDVSMVLKEKTEKPKFIFIHTEDTHYFSTFFTYDAKNVNTILDDIRYAEEYLNHVKDCYKGNLMYDLSIRYVDACFAGLFESVKDMYNNNQLVYCITADHGYSYNRFPIRNRLVNNFHEENYIIPFFLLTNGAVNGEYPYYMLSKDLLMTLYDFCALKVKKSVTGISALNFKKNRAYIITEYMGPGCPDLKHREAWISARNDKRMIAVKVHLTDHTMDESSIVEMYNLESDPLEEQPVNALDDELIFLFNQIRNRWKEIKEENGFA